MVNRNTLTAIALATTCLTPLAAFAQASGTNAGTPPAGATAAPAASAAAASPSTDPNSFTALPFTGEVDLGVMGVMGKNPDQAGRYNGLNTSGPDAVGAFKVQGASPWDSGQTRYFNFSGDNLILQGGHSLGSANDTSSYNRFNSDITNNVVNSGSVKIDLGDQGTWGVDLGYDSITRTGNTIQSIYTVHPGGQATLNGIPAYGGATPTAAGPITNYDVYPSGSTPGLLTSGAEQPVQTGTRRDIFTADGKYIDGAWTFTSSLRHDHKEGSLEESFISKYGGQAFAMPVDYDTDTVNLSAAYNTPVNQAILQYTYSKFVDHNTFVNLPQLTSMTVQPFQESAAYSTPPSNDAHYVTFLGASNALPKTRVNLNLRSGVELQDNTFPPDSADPTLSVVPGFGNLNSLGQGTTDTSLGAEAFVYQGKLSADSHPFDKTDARMFYGFDGRNVSLNQSKVFSTPTGGEGDLSFTTAYYVRPQNWLKQNAGAEAGYLILPEHDTKLDISYRFDVTNRSNAQVGHSTTDTETIGVTSALWSQTHGSLTYEHGDRSGSLNYYVPWENLAGVPGSGVTYSGAYYQAPMTSDQVKLRADYTPLPNLSGGLFIQFRNENYTYPAVTAANSDTTITTGYPITGTGEGIKQDYKLTVGPDVNYRPSDTVNVHFFYTFERIYYNNLGNGDCSTAAEVAVAANCAGSVGYFQNQYTSDVHTFGVNGDWKVSPKWKLAAEYTFAIGSVMFGEFNGVFVSSPTASYQNVSNYPDINSLMNNIKLTAAYEVLPNIDWLIQGGWSYFHNNDWGDTASAVQGAGTTAGATAISILTPGYDSPNYSIFTVMTGMRFKF